MFKLIVKANFAANGNLSHSDDPERGNKVDL